MTALANSRRTVNFDTVTFSSDGDRKAEGQSEAVLNDDDDSSDDERKSQPGV